MTTVRDVFGAMWAVLLLSMGAALLVWAVVSYAQPEPTESTDPPIIMEPVEVDTFTCRAVGRTLAASGSTLTVTLVNKKQTDSTPSAIVTAGPTASGSDLTFTLTPDYGCGASGCRSGNSYQIQCRMKDSAANFVTKNVRLDVKKVQLWR